ncbi:hypothetical protein BLOT_012124 [Blomia tropicalis]|nr:hypothetical protein BLOT_012124 [Blomia tropicalis]
MFWPCLLAVLVFAHSSIHFWIKVDFATFSAGAQLSTTSTTTTTKSWKHQVEEGQNLNEKEDDEDDPRSQIDYFTSFIIHLDKEFNTCVFRFKV